MIKIVLADDHRIFRDGLKSLLSENQNFEIIGEACNGIELMQLLKTMQPDVIITDISMPGMTGIEAMKEIIKLYPTAHIIILSMHTNEEFILNSIKLGAKAYLPKDVSKEELFEAIEEAYKGNEYYSRLISGNFMRNFMKRSISDQNLLENEELTPREIEILRLAASGVGNKDIAEKLFISVKTVDAHKNHIMQKLKLKNTAEMVLYAVKNKIIEI